MVILGLMQVGGLGIMTVASLLVVLVSRRLGLRARLVAQAQSGNLDLSDVRRVLRNVVLFSLAGEAVTAVALAAAARDGLRRAAGDGGVARACSTRCRRSTTRASCCGPTG